MKLGKKITLILLLIILMLPVVYTIFWFGTVGKIRKSLLEVISHAKFYGIEVSYANMTTKGFPFAFQVYVDSPQIIVNNVESLEISANALMFEYKLYSYWLNAFLPDNTIKFKFINNNNTSSLSSVDVKKVQNLDSNTVTCVANELLKLSLRFKSNTLFFKSTLYEGLIMEYINAFKYEDNGLSCKHHEQKDYIVVSKGSVLNIDIRDFKKGNKKGSIFKVNAMLNGHGDPLAQNYYPDIKADFVVDIIENKKRDILNFDISDIIFKGTDFLLSLKGQVLEYNHTLGVFDGKLYIDMINYKKLLEFFINKHMSEKYKDPAYTKKLQELVFNVAERKNDNDISIIITKDEKRNIMLCGNIPLMEFIYKINDLYGINHLHVK